MTLGKKIQKLRPQAGLSQLQLANALSVSRAAIARWENDNGTPDIENLKALAAFFNTDVDTLLDESKDPDFSSWAENIDPEKHPVTGRCRNAYDAVVLSKFMDADRISPASLIFDFNQIERIVNTLTFGMLQFVWQITHWKAYTGIYYFVDNFEQQYLVEIADHKMIITPLAYRTRNIMRQFYVGNRKFQDIGYDLVEK